MKQFIDVHEARSIILQGCRLMEVEKVGLDRALGRTLAEDVGAHDPIPPFDNSAMDGYAVRAEDVTAPGAELSLIEDVPAGRLPRRHVESGTCTRIMTGAPMPSGADTVIPVEETEPVERAGTIVRMKAVPEPGQHVRYAGEDIRPGQTVLSRGRPVTPAVVGMLAALGVARVDVRKRPRVAVIATGDELVGPEDPLGPGKIRNSNGPALAAQAEVAGADVSDVFVARDEPDDLAAVLGRALGNDVVVLSGGVSVGEHDHVKRVLDDAGVELAFWKVRQKPGKPLVFGRGERALVFGLPGNPVSSAVCFEQYVRPSILSMLGRREVFRPRFLARLAAPLRKKKGLYHFVRGTVTFEDGIAQVRPTGPQGSNLYSSVLLADCLVHLPEDIEDPGLGSPVEIEWLSW